MLRAVFDLGIIVLGRNVRSVLLIIGIVPMGMLVMIVRQKEKLLVVLEGVITPILKNVVEEMSVIIM